MWIISKTGFVSVVQHEDDDILMRVRARRREHLVDTFGPWLGDDLEVIDLGEDADDYRWHANVSREDVQRVMVDAVADIDYTSHVKEAVADHDDVFYTAMLRCWQALHKLQTS